LRSLRRCLHWHLNQHGTMTSAVREWQQNEEESERKWGFLWKEMNDTQERNRKWRSKHITAQTTTFLWLPSSFLTLRTFNNSFLPNRYYFLFNFWLLMMVSRPTVIVFHFKNFYVYLIYIIYILKIRYYVNFFIYRNWIYVLKIYNNLLILLKIVCIKPF